MGAVTNFQIKYYKRIREIIAGRNNRNPNGGRNNRLEIIGPEKVGHEKVGPEKIGPEKVGPDKIGAK